MGPGSTLGDIGAAIKSFIFGESPTAPNETSISLISPSAPILGGPGPSSVPSGVEIPDIPAISAIPEITPTLELPSEEKVAAKEAANAEMERRRKRRGSTTVTGPQGILTAPPTKKATLG